MMIVLTADRPSKVFSGGMVLMVQRLAGCNVLRLEQAIDKRQFQMETMTLALCMCLVCDNSAHSCRSECNIYSHTHTCTQLHIHKYKSVFHSCTG